VRRLRAAAMPGLVLACLLPVASAVAADALIVVLKGGTRIELQRPWVQQGNNAILTRADGTVFSVPVSEIDLKATAAAKRVVPPPDPAAVPPPQTPVEALRLGREGPRAKVRLTDADVSHETVLAQPSTPDQGKAETGKGSARLDVAGYDQSKSGSNALVRGSVRNFGGTAASNARMSITALDENGVLIGTAEASLSKGSLEPSETVAFTATVPVGDKIVAAFRFSPQWIAAPPPASAAEIAAAAAKPGQAAAGAVPGGASGSAAAANQPPAPLPTPYGLGVLYAPPAAAAATTPPKDDRIGYIPGATDPASQPKPPNQ
jgi:hypothetical protein